MVEAQRLLELQFFSLPMWVRIYEVPFRGRYNEENARMLGDKVGEFMEMDKYDSLGMEKSLRIRVKVDVCKPLKRSVSIKIWGGESCRCPVKYEKLPLICFLCRMLGHGTNDCKEVVGDSSPVKNFGPWLKASPWKPMVKEETQEGVGHKQSCGQRILFAKPITRKEEEGDRQVSNINMVTTLLDKVALGNNGE